MQTVLITGASRGIGKEMAFLFAQNNYNVVINYKQNLKEALKVEQKIKDNYSVKTLVIQADISKEEEVKQMVEESIKTFGKIDVLINNAALSLDEELATKKTSDFQKVIDTNLIGTYLVSKYVCAYMLKEKNGCIINIASNNGIDTNHLYSLDYDASKAGVISLTHNFAQYLAPFGRVNAIAPGWVATDSVLAMNPNIIKEETEKCLLKRMATPREIANVALFLASNEASYINSTVIRVDGGKNA